MQHHHVIRGGLFLTGVVIGSFGIVASAGAGSRHLVTAPAADVVALVAPAEASSPSGPVPVAPAATPVLVASASPDATPTDGAAAPAVGEEAEPGSDPPPDVPVIHAGPGPVTPVPGAVTLIDPLVIVREPADPTA
jgi:hypothetical protein